MPVRSINLLGEAKCQLLLEAGHEVTYVTVFPLDQKPINNFRQINVSSNLEFLNGKNIINTGFLVDHGITTTDIDFMQQFGIAVLNMTFQNKEIKNLLEDTKEHFDVVISDWLESETYAGLSALYNCAMIWSYSMGAHWNVLRLVDQPTNLAFSMGYFSQNIPPLNFMQRLQELWFRIRWYYLKRFKTMPIEEHIYKTVFGPLLRKRGRNLPLYEDLIFNASLILANDFDVGGILSAIPQNFKLIGGYHIKSNRKSLSKDVQSIMDNSKNGVIYFSLGSNWKSKDLPSKLSQELLNMFGQLNYTVIWKYEEYLTNVPENVYTVDWAPQSSILAHPKCLLFINHGGQLSTLEALHFGIPTIGVPVYFDQFANVNRAVLAGYGMRVDLNYDLPRNLKIAIQTVVSNQRFKNVAKEVSMIFHDRPTSPDKEFVHWVEHIISSRGAKHLRSPGLLVPWYQKIFLDIFVLAVACCFVIISTIKKIVSIFHVVVSPKIKKN